MFNSKTARAFDNQSLYLSVVIPVYNEESTIATVVDLVMNLPNLLEVAIVDDGSTDKTPEIIQQLAQKYPKVAVVVSERNAGKTNALKKGFLNTKGDIVVVQDADLEYDPREIPELIQPLVEGKSGAVYGSRFLVRRAARVLYFHHFLANQFLTFLSNLFTNLNMTDIETGYKAFRGEIIRNMVIKSDGFGFEIEVTAKIAKLARVGLPVYEVPISYYGRTYAEGKKIGLKDGLAALWYIFRFNLFCNLKSSFYRLPELIENYCKENPLKSMK
ncbi:glycosyltransferase family 2 protein [Okeania sp. SIO1I7]|uniref:glycosyltransferase family 2 protein n=1 Tax=Okeania sp. SIO1I7 TaxID=2607772 RepID=UPI0013F6F4AB|nr:glycosyltransferase family 2 protein [Okeania sp. SIO1I7]NET28210.1 glycosyltransferase family 2 protein [Okeania sp. SIO1I7]